MVQRRCDNCIFSTYATGSGRAVLICRQKAGEVGRWKARPMLGKCANFYPSTAAKKKLPRLIPLTRGKFAIVDAEDYAELSKHTWFASGRADQCYAVRKENGKSIKMHRQILNAPDHLLVDHIDHEGLNNRRGNLRLATKSQNSQNQRRSSRASSKYKGVCWNRQMKKWTAQISSKKKTYHLGCFGDEREAAKAYDTAAKKYHREFASFNFPRDARASG